MAKKRLNPAIKRSRTRSGCLTCRDRHMKCDEQKPVCRNCIKSKRKCYRGIRLNFTQYTIYNPDESFQNRDSYNLESAISAEFPPDHTETAPANLSEFASSAAVTNTTTNMTTASTSAPAAEFKLLDQSITIASLYQNGKQSYEPYMHLHNPEDLTESDLEYQKDIFCTLPTVSASTQSYQPSASPKSATVVNLSSTWDNNENANSLAATSIPTPTQQPEPINHSVTIAPSFPADRVFHPAPSEPFSRSDNKIHENYELTNLLLAENYAASSNAFENQAYLPPQQQQQQQQQRQQQLQHLQQQHQFQHQQHLLSNFTQETVTKHQLMSNQPHYISASSQIYPPHSENSSALENHNQPLLNVGFPLGIDINVFVGLIENEKYYWFLDMFNELNIWKSIVPSYCLHQLESSEGKATYLIKCLMNCSAYTNVDLSTLLEEQLREWNSAKQLAVVSSDNIRVFESLLISVTLILLSIQLKLNKQIFTDFYRIVLNNQFKIFNNTMAKIKAFLNSHVSDANSNNNDSVLLINSIQAIIILKYFLIKKFGFDDEFNLLHQIDSAGPTPTSASHHHYSRSSMNSAQMEVKEEEDHKGFEASENIHEEIVYPSQSTFASGQGPGTGHNNLAQNHSHGIKLQEQALTRQEHPNHQIHQAQEHRQDQQLQHQQELQLQHQQHQHQLQHQQHSQHQHQQQGHQQHQQEQLQHQQSHQQHQHHQQHQQQQPDLHQQHRQFQHHQQQLQMHNDQQQYSLYEQQPMQPQATRNSAQTPPTNVSLDSFLKISQFELENLDETFKKFDMPASKLQDQFRSDSSKLREFTWNMIKLNYYLLNNSYVKSNGSNSSQRNEIPSLSKLSLRSSYKLDYSSPPPTMAPTPTPEEPLGVEWKTLNTIHGAVLPNERGIAAALMKEYVNKLMNSNGSSQSLNDSAMFHIDQMLKLVDKSSVDQVIKMGWKCHFWWMLNPLPNLSRDEKSTVEPGMSY